MTKYNQVTTMVMTKKCLMTTFLISQILLCTFANASDVAEEVKDSQNEIQDMSDPLAVYTQFGAGWTDKGLNIKIGQTYNTGNKETMAMNLIEVKGFLGESLGWSGSSERNNSIDSMRLRNGQVNTKNGRGYQLDVSYNFNSNALADSMGTVSYSFVQALPEWNRISLYPLAGVGLAYGNNVLEDDYSIDSGFSVPGAFALIGMYSRIKVTDKVWINYNPMWLTTIAGSNLYKDYAMQGNPNVLAHEVAVSYQINPRLNVRYYANWTTEVDYLDGDQRIEINYQF